MRTSRLKLQSVAKVIVLISIPILFWRFYWYIGFNHNRTALLSFLLAAGLLLYLIYLGINGRLRRINRKSTYSVYILLFMLVVLFSMFNAGLFWNQSLVLTFRAGYSVFVLLYFYLLYRFELSFELGERLILFFSTVYFLLWLYAVSQAPAVVFGNLDVIRDDRGFARINQLNSIDLVYLAYFISLVKLSTSSTTKKTVWWGVLIVSFALIVYTLSRMVILATLLITLVYIFRRKPFYLLLAVLFVSFFYGYIINNPVVASLIELTQDEVESGSKSALRVVEYTQFGDYYPFRISTFLFGNGAPHVASSYGVYEESLKASFRFNRSDAGYIGMYVTYGISSIVLLILLLMKVIKQKVSLQAMPFKLFVIFLFIINITSWEFFSCGIGFVISLYFLDIDRNRSLGQVIP